MEITFKRKDFGQVYRLASPFAIFFCLGADVVLQQVFFSAVAMIFTKSFYPTYRWKRDTENHLSKNKCCD